MRLLPEDCEHGWTPYAWLIYLAFYVSYAVVAHLHSWMLLAHGAGLLAFLALYFRGYWVDATARAPIIVALAVLGALVTLFNPGAVTFFVYAAAFVGGTRFGRSAALWLLVLTVAAIGTVWLRGWPSGVLVMGLLLPPMIGGVNLHYAEVRERDLSLRLANDALGRLAVVAERERIARDLHDLLGHTLSVIVLKAELASKLISRDAGRAATEIADVERISREALGEVRRAVHGFRTASFDDEVVRARGVLQTAGIALEGNLTTDADLSSRPALAARAEQALSFVLRECMTNIVRHAHATRCCLSLTRAGQCVRLEIEDDGVGGDGEGHGVQGMRVRIEDVHGTFERDGRHGTIVRVTVPDEDARPAFVTAR